LIDYTTQMARPLHSTPITEASPLLRAGPPARSATVLNNSQFLLLAALPLGIGHTLDRHRFRSTPSHVPRESRRPDSRRLHAGHHLANKRAPARLVLTPYLRLSFDAI